MTFSKPRTAKLVIACLGLLAGSAFGYWGYDEYRRHELRTEIVTLVADSSDRLRDALVNEAVLTAASSPAVLRRYYDHAEAVDAHLRRLRTLETHAAGELARAADDYILTTREILLRRASSHRSRLELAGSAQALHAHMRADDRTGGWIRTAVRAKERVEEDYRDYRIAINALGNLLEGFPAARDRLEAHVAAEKLADAVLVDGARARTAESARRTQQEVERVSLLAAYR